MIRAAVSGPMISAPVPGPAVDVQGRRDGDAVEATFATLRVSGGVPASDASPRMYPPTDRPMTYSFTRRLPGLLLLAALLTLHAPAALQAQTLRGKVTDGRTQAPLADVLVSLLDEDANALVQTETAADGSFTLAAPAPGEYYIRGEKLSYQTVTDGIFVLESTDAVMSLAFFLNPAPTELEGIDVRIARAETRRRLRNAGFYQRAASGFGRFIGPDEIEKRPVFVFGDFLRNIPGIRFDGEQITFRNPNAGPGGSQNCSPIIYIDAARVNADFGITTLIQPEEVEGIEVYRGVAQVPLEWGGINGACGALVIWTKAGR
jgi:hypothetical protein